MNNLPIKLQTEPKDETYVMKGNKGMCYICNIPLTSLEHCRQHVQGSKHMKKVKVYTSCAVQPVIRRSSLPNIEHTSQPNKENTFRSVWENILQHNSDSEIKSNMENTFQHTFAFPPTFINAVKTSNMGTDRKIFDVEGPGGRCFVCNVDFTSVELANQHLAGQKHRKKIVSHNSFEEADVALTGVVGTEQNVDQSSSPLAKSEQNIGNCSNALKSEDIARYSSSTNSQTPGNSLKGPNGEEYAFSNNKGFCFVCQLELTSNAHAKSHLEGKSHKKKCMNGFVNNLSDISSSSKTLMCKICQVVFSGIKNATQHFESEKHKKKASKSPITQEMHGSNTFMQTQHIFDPEETEVMKVWTPVQVGTTRYTSHDISHGALNDQSHDTSNNLSHYTSHEPTHLNELERDSATSVASELIDQRRNSQNLLSPLVNVSVNSVPTTATLSYNYTQFRSLPFTQIQNLETQTFEKNQFNKACVTSIFTTYNLPGTCITSVGANSKEAEVTNTNIETDYMADDGISTRSTTNKKFIQNDNLSCNQNELYKVGDKRISLQVNNSDLNIHDNIGENSINTNMQPQSKNNSTHSLNGHQDETKHLLSAEGDNSESACVQTGISKANFKIAEKNYFHEQETQQQEDNHNKYNLLDPKLIATFVKSEESKSILENVLSDSQESPALSCTATTPSSQIARPYYFDGVRGFCYCCNVELTSSQHANQHLNGQKHKKKQGQLVSTQAINARQQTQTDTYLDHSFVVPTNIGKVQENSFYFDGNRGFCYVCKIELSSCQHMQQHVNGKQHKRNKERSKQETTYPLNCTICNKLFSGQECAKQHFSSSRHAINAVMNDSTQIVTCIDGGKVFMKDGQTWYFCDVCKVPLNTKEQFLIHKDSPKHRKESESIVRSQDIAVQNKMVPDFSNKASELQKDHGTCVQENYHRIDQYTHPRHVNLAQSDSENTQNQHEQMESKSERLQVLHDNLHYLTYGQPAIISQERAALERLPQHIKPQISRDPRPNFQHDQIDSSALSEAFNTQPTQRVFGTTEMPTNTEQGKDYNGPGAGIKITSFKNTSRLDAESAKPSSSVNTNTASRSAAVGHVSHLHPCSDMGNISTVDSLLELGYSNQENNIQMGQNQINSSLRNGTGDLVDNFGQIISVPKSSNQKRNYNGDKSKDISTIDKKEFDATFDATDEEPENRDHFNIKEEELVPKMAELKLELEPSKPMRSDRPGLRYYCPVCKQHMNTKEMYDSHIQGKRHLYNMSNCQAPDRSLDPILKKYNGHNLPAEVHKMVDESLKMNHRPYQTELVEKAMMEDCIVYLPTGTGKTFVAVLTMGIMLRENPCRPVLFLVDKVLLVMQQARNIMNCFAKKKFERLDLNQGSVLEERMLKVMPICSAMTIKTNLPIWKHDIIVTTADYCINMLNRGIIHWKDFSLVVLDEVHHCKKGHPYHKLMSKYHNVLPKDSRAKVLGLTASPAGKSTVEQTFSMLTGLLTNLGGATVAIVEEEIRALECFQSNAKVRAICVPMTTKEKEFKCHLLEYSVLCISQWVSMAKHLCINDPPFSYFRSALDKPGNREVAMDLAIRLLQDSEPLNEVMNEIFSTQYKDDSDYERSHYIDNLRVHICQLILVIPEIGIGTGIEELLKALEPSSTSEFVKNGLPCKQMFERVQLFAEDGNNDVTMFNKLVETLHNPDIINWSDPSSRALVLVRERIRAKQYSIKLREHSMVKRNGLRVGHIVGHGKGAKDGGMGLKKQRMIFDNHERFHILVATSIMEEGIDIQALQLVICMNPPNSMRALVQMRGRARKKDSHFIVLCSSEEDVDKLESLKKQETHMLQATELCLKEKRSQVVA